MKDIDIKQLIEWLGSEGALAGLEASQLTVSQLHDIATRHEIVVEKRTKRSEIIIDLVYGNVTRIDKTREQLLEMDDEELRNYFLEKKVSRAELLKLLSELDIRPIPHDRASLKEFAAREISDVGMYQRVAKGVRRT